MNKLGFSLRHLDIIESIAIEAGDLAASMMGRVTVSAKDTQGNDLVTEADKRSQELILKRLKDEFPGIDLIGEEDSSHAIKSNTFFAVDPIDGTTNFTRKGGDWGVLIGLLVEGVPTVGVMYQPVRQRIAKSLQGQGCFLQGQPLHFGPGRELKRSIISVEMAWALDPNLHLPKISRIPLSSLGIRNVFSAIGNGFDVLTGGSDAYMHPKGGSVWDFLAIAAVILEAGGVCSHPDGSQVKWDQIKMSVLFANHKELLSELVNLWRD